MPFAPQYEILLDGSCSFCRWIQTRIEPYDSDARLRFLDYNDPSVAALTTLTPRDLRSEMNVRTPEGVWLKGFDAWVAILRVLPKLVWFARLATVPPINWLGPTVYKFIARHRHAFPGVPARCADDTCALPTQHHGR